jgi:hypothetical protein
MVMIANEMPAAIRPYSIAVAPDSSDMNCLKTFFNLTSRMSALLARFQVPHEEHEVRPLTFVKADR